MKTMTASPIFIHTMLYDDDDCDNSGKGDTIPTLSKQVVTDSGKVRLIDLEYSGPNYAAFDIGNLFNEYDDEYEDYVDNDHDDTDNGNQLKILSMVGPTMLPLTLTTFSMSMMVTMMILMTMTTMVITMVMSPLVMVKHSNELVVMEVAMVMVLMEMVNVLI